MNKQQVQKRIHKNDELLDLDLFQWDENSKVLRTQESNIRCYFHGIDGVSFYFGAHCYVEAGDNTKVRGLSGNEVKIGNNGDIRTFDNLTCLAGTNTVFNVGSYCDILIGHNSKGKVKDCSGIQVSGMGTFKTGNECTITTLGNSIIRMGSGCKVYRDDIQEIIDMDLVKGKHADIARYDLKIELNDNGISGYRVLPRYGY
jgi:hypothetical protein